MGLDELKRTVEGLGITPSDWRSKDALREAIRGATGEGDVVSEKQTHSVSGTVHISGGVDSTDADIKVLLLSAANSLTKAAELLDR